MPVGVQLGFALSSEVLVESALRVFAEEELAGLLQTLGVTHLVMIEHQSDLAASVVQQSLKL